jgi:hypothetical protein
MVFIKKTKIQNVVFLSIQFGLSPPLYFLHLFVNEDAERESSSVEKRNTTVVFMFSPRFTVFRSGKKEPRLRKLRDG